MYRPRRTLLQALLLATALAGVAVVTLAGVPSGTVRAAEPASTRLAIHMSDRDGGEPMRSFFSTTTQVHAVISFEGARNENYQVRLSDLVGIVVFNESVRLDG